MPSAVKDQSGPGGFPVIELYQLDKRKFFPLSTVGSLTVQVVTYPLTLLRTRLQLQEGHKVYRGLLHCFRTVLGQEGVRGLYAGFWVKNFQVLSSVMYAYTYERVREDTRGMSPTMRSFLGGGCASLVSQTVLVPLDVVSQHLQVLSRAPGASSRTLTPICISEAEASTAPSRALAVVRTLYRRNGVAAFYKGYVISIAHFVPNSALWWAFYNFYCDAIGRAAVALMSVGQPGPQDPQQLPPACQSSWPPPPVWHVIRPHHQPHRCGSSPHASGRPGPALHSAPPVDRGGRRLRGERPQRPPVAVLAVQLLHHFVLRANQAVLAEGRVQIVYFLVTPGAPVPHPAGDRSAAFRVRANSYQFDS
ncbi:hypothetical protein BOX15_Mlig015956g1 [Macrostomum lignano]|uniref:Solute carrier family 25 member 44 n=1 Tax=Macrostomum lignano TaxID=282301 RepID=A0A267H8R1_9PLAT|nr:hypothetical protein BOX15_Mlig015956g1 [Macrostomum lignano]